MDEQKIIRYLDGEMDPPERKDFESEMDRDPSLRREVEAYRRLQDLAGRFLADREGGGTEWDPPEPAIRDEIDRAVRAYREEKATDLPPGLKARLEEAAGRYFQARPEHGKGANLVRLPGTWFVAAALLLLALVVSMFLFNPPAPVDPGDLYARHYETFKPTETELERVRDDDSLRFAMEVYSAENYEHAAALFEQIQQSGGDHDIAWFYLAQSYMAMDRCSEAFPLLRRVMADPGSELRIHARWYLALCLLKTGELELAREHFQSLVERQSRYRRKAGRILRVLK